jgi:hypothetical protein
VRPAGGGVDEGQTETPLMCRPRARRRSACAALNDAANSVRAGGPASEPPWDRALGR